jgi:hypothetical protein
MTFGNTDVTMSSELSKENTTSRFRCVTECNLPNVPTVIGMAAVYKKRSQSG